MQEKPLLLPSAKTAVLVEHSPTRVLRLVRLSAIGVGILCVLFGAADVMSRLADAAGGENAAFLAFGPAVALQNPGALVQDTQGAFVPTRLSIPALGVNASIESVGKKADGTMGTPQNFDNVSWYSLGGKPGGPGSAVFAGHVNNALMKKGVFEHLSQLKKGDYITVSSETGRSKVYRVSSTTEYPADASTEEIFTTQGPSKLVLITCDGEWVPSAKTFDKRLVVVAQPAY